MKVIFAVIILAFVCCQCLSAVELTIEAAQQMALEHAIELKKARVEYDAYQSHLKTARAERYPNLSLEVKALYNSEISSLDIELPAITLHRDIGQHEIYQADLDISLPLYTGGKISSGINLARANLLIRDALVTKSEEQISFLARQEYLRLYKLKKLVDASKAALDRSEILKHEIATLYGAGSADSVDLFEVEISNNKAELMLEQAANNYRRQEIILLVMIGEDTDQTIIIASAPEKPGSTMPAKIQGISENKPDLLVARSRIAVDQSLYYLDRASYIPNINLVGNFSYGKPNISPFEDSFNSNVTVGAMLNWSFNLGGKTGSKVSMAKYQLASSEHEYERINEEITKEARLAYESLKLAFAAYDIAVKNHNISVEAFRLARIKNQEGVLSSNHLLDIEAELSRSESLLFSSEADYHLAMNQYRYTTGYQYTLGGN